MKLIEPKVEFVKPKSLYEDIEKAARTCYKSEDKIQYDYDGNSVTAEKFVNNIVNVKKHASVAEHGTVYLKTKYDFNDIDFYIHNPYSKVSFDNDTYYITTNHRVLVENNRLDDLKYLSEYEKGKHHKRWTFRFYTQIAMSREANRHRKNSMAEQSTRYCNYSKDKHGNEINICIPEFINELDEKNVIGLYNDCVSHFKTKWMRALCLEIGQGDDQKYFDAINYWLVANMICEYCHMNLLRLGIKPEDARTILPLDTQTELVHTAYVSDWIHFLKLRLAETAHPDMRLLAKQMIAALLEAGEIDNEDIDNISEKIGIKICI